MASAGQIPMGLQLAVSDPLGIRVYRRRFQSPMTNLQTAGPDDHINIYPDTSTPGAFIDHESTYLSFDFTIKNNEFGVDYTDFGVEGAAGALIQSWRVYNQGTILEEILDYPTVASALANAEGAYQAETSMYFSSKLKGGFQDECHRNFIKPPMVSGSGNCMFGPNPFGLGSEVSQLGDESVYTNSQATGLACGQMLYNPSLGLVVQKDALGLAMTDSSIESAFKSTLAKAGNNSAVVPDIHSDTWTGVTTPAAFPDYFVPSMVDIVRNDYIQEFGTINKTQIMANLCNVKCFPIGMIPGINCFSAATGFVTGPDNLGENLKPSTAMTPATAAVEPLPSNPSYRICYRPLSGIFGKLASKMVATTLMAPQQLYISIHLAQPAVVFNVSADPCRRIAGTIRDFVRNVGTRNGVSYGSSASQYYFDVTTPYTPQTTSYATGYTPMTSVKLSSLNTLETSKRNSLIALPSAACCKGQVLLTSNSYAETGGVIPEDTDGNSRYYFMGQGKGVFAPPPTPQYVPCKSSWKYNCLKVPGAIVDYAAECETFYGTYLQASEPQSRRILGKYITGETNNALPRITYTITNMNLVGDQLILPDETTSDVLLAAEAGNYNVSTQSVRTYPLQVNAQESQAIILPIKVNMAKRLFVVFQDMESRNSTLGFLHDSNCGLNPFACVKPSAGSLPATRAGLLSGGVSGTLTGVGMDNPLEYNFCKAGANQGISMQLRIGNDFYPPQPLTTIQEISTELVKTLEGWQDAGFSPDIDSRVVQNGSGAQNLMFDCLQPSKYCTAFIPNSLLDDQTITSNPDFVPLYSFNQGAPSSAGSNTLQPQATETSAVNGYNMRCPRGYCAQGIFKSPSSRFMLGFNLSGFKEIDGVDGGTYLGNNTITLIMSGCVGFVPGRSYRGLAIVPHRAIMRYSPGGQIVWVY